LSKGNDARFVKKRKCAWALATSMPRISLATELTLRGAIFRYRRLAVAFIDGLSDRACNVYGNALLLNA